MQPLVGQRRAGDVAAWLLKRLALVRAAAHCGMQTKPVVGGAQTFCYSNLMRIASSAVPLPSSMPFTSTRRPGARSAALPFS